MQVDKDYSAYQQSDYRIADGDVFSQGCNAFIVLFHKLILSNYSPSKNGGLLVPHAASLQREAGVFLSMLILLPSTYISRPAWEVGEQEGGQARLPYRLLIGSTFVSLAGGVI